MSNQNFHESKYIQILSKIPICHRLPDRTFNIRGHYFPVCARCKGFYIGAFSYFTHVYSYYVQYKASLVLLAIFIMIFKILWNCFSNVVTYWITTFLSAYSFKVRYWVFVWVIILLHRFMVVRLEVRVLKVMLNLN